MNNIFSNFFNHKKSDDDATEEAVVTEEEQEESPLDKYLKPNYGNCRHNLNNKLVDAMLERMFMSAVVLVSLSKELLKSLFSTFGHEYFEDVEGGFSGCRAYQPFDRPIRYRNEEPSIGGTELDGYRTFIVDFHRQLFDPVRQKARHYDYGQVKRYHVFAVLVVNKPIPTDGEVYTLPMLERKFYKCVSYRYDESEYHFEEISLGDFEDMLRIEDEADEQLKEAKASV